MILLSDILTNGLNSWGNFKIVVVCTIFSPDVYLTNGLSSANLSGSACIALNRLINDLPFLHYQLNYLKHFGIKNVIFSVGYLAENIKNYFGNNFTFKFTFSLLYFSLLSFSHQ